jgi:hypothetical protein
MTRTDRVHCEKGRFSYAGRQSLRHRPTLGGPAFAAPSRAMRLLDTDNDGTVDLEETKKAASTLFNKLDRDHDGTLDRRELRGRLSATEFASADPDKDGTLSKDEYLPKENAHPVLNP